MRHIVHMGYLCQTFRCLPDPGGLFQQDSYKMWLLTIYLDAQAEKQEKEMKASQREREGRR